MKSGGTSWKVLPYLKFVKSEWGDLLRCYNYVLYCNWRDVACASACLLGFIFWPGPIKAIVTNEKTLKNDEKLCSDMEYTM